MTSHRPAGRTPTVTVPAPTGTSRVSSGSIPNSASGSGEAEVEFTVGSIVVHFERKGLSNHPVVVFEGRLLPLSLGNVDTPAVGSECPGLAGDHEVQRV